MRNPVICLALISLIFSACSGSRQADLPVEATEDYSHLSKTEKMALTDPAKPAPPGFVVSLQGDTLPLSHFSGKLLVVDFWATWCSPCIELIPKMHEFAKRYKSKSVAFVTVSVDGDQAFWKQFVAEQQWEENAYWIGEDEQNPLFWYVYQAYTTESDSSIIMALPKFALISAEGIILKKGFMPPHHPAFEEVLQQHLGPL